MMQITIVHTYSGLVVVEERLPRARLVWVAPNLEIYMLNRAYTRNKHTRVMEQAGNLAVNYAISIGIKALDVRRAK